MRTLALAALAAISSSCVVHVHVHESPHETAISAVTAPTARQGSPHASESFTSTVSGVVVDATGKPVKARVAIVNAHGSVSSTTDDAGRFSLESHADSGLVAHASTEDNRVAFQSVHAGANDVRLVLAPGALVTIDFTGPSAIRCAVFQGDTRMEDFTVRPNQPARVVVPSGPVLVRLYGDRTVHVEQSFTVAAGDRQHAGFALGG